MLINGSPITEAFNILSVSFSSDLDLNRVEGLSKNHRSSGFTQGNSKPQFSMDLAVPAKGLGGFDPAEYKWYDNKAVVQCIGSSELYGSNYNGDTIQFIDVAFSGFGDSGAKGAGREITYTWNFEALGMKRIPG